MSKVWFVTGASSGNRCRHVALMNTCPSRRMAASDEHAKGCHPTTAPVCRGRLPTIRDRIEKENGNETARDDYHVTFPASFGARRCAPGKSLIWRRCTDSGDHAERFAAIHQGTSRILHWFCVRIDPLFKANDPSRTSGASVTFEPGARTAWHTHPLGQTLIVTAGCGWVQQWGGQIEEIRQGDVVRIPPGQKHWHGATATTGMTHIAIQEQLDGKAVEWMEKVRDEQYRR